MSDIDKNIYSVSKLNNYIKRLFDGTPSLKFLTIKGEVYDLKKSGPHHYYMLKDETSSIRGVLFYSDASKLDPRIKDGDEVLIVGSVSVFPSKGQYQIYASSISLFGVGNLLEQLEKLKQKLNAEGLFDTNKKKPINIYPNRVGIISAKTSAAVQDMIVNLKRRYPIAEIFIFDSLMQGEGAPKDVIKAFETSKQYNLDTLIIGRGGGASEDLSAFNDECLVRALATRNIPLISAVGHEIDTTLIDLVADRRASTPTGAVELASVDTREVLDSLNEQRKHLYSCIKRKLEMHELALSKLKQRPELINPLFSFDERVKKVLLQKKLLNSSMTSIIAAREHKISTIYQLSTRNTLVKYQNDLSAFEIAKSSLLALNPTSILERGYSITKDKDGNIIKNISQVNINDEIETTFHNGSVKSSISSKKENK